MLMTALYAGIGQKQRQNHRVLVLTPTNKQPRGFHTYSCWLILLAHCLLQRSAVLPTTLKVQVRGRAGSYCLLTAYWQRSAVLPTTFKVQVGG